MPNKIVKCTERVIEQVSPNTMTHNFFNGVGYVYSNPF